MTTTDTTDTTDTADNETAQEMTDAGDADAAANAAPTKRTIYKGVTLGEGPCTIEGCDRHAADWSDALPTELRTLCFGCRHAAQTWRSKRKCTPAEAVAYVVDLRARQTATRAHAAKVPPKKTGKAPVKVSTGKTAKTLATQPAKPPMKTKPGTTADKNVARELSEGVAIATRQRAVVEHLGGIDAAERAAEYVVSVGGIDAVRVAVDHMLALAGRTL